MTLSSKMPKNEAMSTYIAKKIYELAGRKNQREIAAEIGYDKPNMISMFKTGETNVPLCKIPALARAIEGDAAHMFRLALEVLADEDLAIAIHEIFGNTVSKNEAEIVDFIRAASEDSDVALTPKLREVLSAGLTIVVSPAQPKTSSTAPEQAVATIAPVPLQDMNFKVSPAFHRQFKLEATRSGISMKELLEKSFEAFQNSGERVLNSQ